MERVAEREWESVDDEDDRIEFVRCRCNHQRNSYREQFDSGSGFSLVYRETMR